MWTYLPAYRPRRYVNGLIVNMVYMVYIVYMVYKVFDAERRYVTDLVRTEGDKRDKGKTRGPREEGERCMCICVYEKERMVQAFKGLFVLSNFV